MTATKVQLIGGQFQDAEGNKLSLGYLIMKLAMDANIVGVGNIVSGIEIKILLDANGSVVTSPAQSVWGVDQMLPVNNYYRVTGYTAQGQPAWGPNNQQVIGSGGTFDVGTWIPNQVISWTPPLQALTLETNETLNANQGVLDFKDTASVTWASDSSGKMRATASHVGIASAGYFWNYRTTGLTANGGTSVFCGYTGSPGSQSPAANTLQVVQFVLDTEYTISKVTIGVSIGSGGGTYILAGVYSADGLTKLLDCGNSAFDGTANGVKTVVLSSPVTLPAGTYWCAVSCNTSSFNASACTFYVPLATTATNGRVLNGTTPRVGTAANVQSGGNLPATLGAVTAINTASDVSFSAVLFEV